MHASFRTFRTSQSTLCVQVNCWISQLLTYVQVHTLLWWDMKAFLPFSFTIVSCLYVKVLKIFFGIYQGFIEFLIILLCSWSEFHIVFRLNFRNYLYHFVCNLDNSFWNAFSNHLLFSFSMNSVSRVPSLKVPSFSIKFFRVARTHCRRLNETKELFRYKGIVRQK